MQPAGGARERVGEEGDEQQPVWPSVDVVYAELKDRVALQLAQADTLDNKSNFGLGSAALLTAGVAALRNASEPAIGKEVERWCLFGWILPVTVLVTWITVGAFAAFVAVVWCSYQAYKVRTFTISPSIGKAGTEHLLDVALHRPPNHTKVLMSHHRVVEDLFQNERQIERKTRWTAWSLIALVVEAVLLLTMSVLEAFV